MNRSSSMLKRIGGSIVGGLSANLAYPDVGWWPFIIFALGALLWSLEDQGPGLSVLLGTLWGLAFFLPHLWWSAVATDPIPWIALSSLQAAFIGLFGFAYWLGTQWRSAAAHLAIRMLIVAPILWTGIEALRSRVPFGGFPWGRVAYSQAESSLGRFAWLGGVGLVTLLCVALAGASVVLAVTLLSGRWRAATWLVGGLVAVVTVSPLIPLATSPESGSLKVALIQGNVDNPGMTGQAQSVFDNHVAQTTAALDDARLQGVTLDLVIWPEDSVGFDLSLDPQAVQQVTEIVDETGLPFVLGTQEYPADGGRYNLSLVWLPHTGESDRYAKQIPVPFGEYIPMRSFFRLFSHQVDRVTTDMIGANEPAITQTPVAALQRSVTLAPIICFEIAYEHIVHEAVRLGAEVIVVQTNNANFGYTAESTQQLAMTQISAISNGRSAVQVSTVGVSAAVLADGTVVERTNLFEPGYIIADLPLRQTLTPATRMGFWPQGLSGLGSILIVALGSWHRLVRTATTSKK